MTSVKNIYGMGTLAMEKIAEYGGQPEILTPVHIIQRPITVHYEDSDKGTVFGIDIPYYPEERDDKGELIKNGHYVLLSYTVEST